MDTGDLIYVLIGVVWLLYSFFTRGKKKTTLPEYSSDPSGAEDMPEYLPVEDSPAPTRKILEPLRVSVPQTPVLTTAKPSPFGEGLGGAKGKDLGVSNKDKAPPAFDLRQAVIHYEILKKPEY